MVAPLIIFALTYLVVSGQRLPFLRLDRPGAALCGAVAMVVTGTLTIREAYAAINLDTITLLLGMMIIAAYLVEARFFDFTAWWVLGRMQGARSLLWALVFVAGGLSALLVNDTICLMFTPLVIAAVTQANLPPLPYLLALASASNLGGMVTFTGNPQNMIIGMAANGHPSYLGYAAHVLPAGALCLAVDAAVLCWMFRHELPRGPLIEHHTLRPALDRRLAAFAVAALLLFVVLAAAGVSLAGAAITAAAALMLVARSGTREALVRVDWPLLLFFAGLFVVVAGVAHTGIVDLFHPGSLGTPAFVGLNVVGANVLSNVPYVLVALHWVPGLPDPSYGYLVLAVSATLAGNLTLFGSVANVIVFEGAGEHGKIGFLRFLKYGLAITGATLATAFGVLELERLFGF